MELALNESVRAQLSRLKPSSVPPLACQRSTHLRALTPCDTWDSADFLLCARLQTIRVHKVIIAARSSFFDSLLKQNPLLDSWRAPDRIPSEALQACICYVYDDVDGMNRIRTMWMSEEIDLHIAGLAAMWRLKIGDIALATGEFKCWFDSNILTNAISSTAARQLRASTQECAQTFADVLVRSSDGSGALRENEESSACTRAFPVIFPAHKCILTCCDYFGAMFRQPWLEATQTPWLRVVTIDCSPDVLKIILESLYTGTTACPERLATEVLRAADMILMESLKIKAGLTCASMVEILEDDALESLRKLSVQTRLPWLENHICKALRSRDRPRKRCSDG